ncbi:MAG TPA: signal peptidase I [Candidatus Paceibacterota bacterium]
MNEELNNTPENVVVDKLSGNRENSTWELVRFAIIALLIVIPVRFFVAQPFVVSGSSMLPTFEDKNYLVIDELSYRLSDPQRNDVIVFKYPLDTKKFFIKRIIALPNETLDVRGSTVTITNEEHKDGFVLDQPYINNKSNNDIHITLKDDEYYVMGDNRDFSSDSRSWGALPRELIVGRVYARLWPLKYLDILPGKYVQEE